MRVGGGTRRQLPMWTTGRFIIAGGGSVPKPEPEGPVWINSGPK